MRRFHTTIWWRFILLAALVPSIIVLALRIETNIDDVYQWLPDDSPGLVTYEWFLEHFGSDDVVVVSWPECGLDDPRIPVFANQLSELRGAEYIDEVMTGPEVIGRLTGENSQLTRDEVIERLAGTLIGANGETTCLTIRLTPSGQRHRTEAIQDIFRAAAATPGLSRGELRMAGYPYSGYVAEAAITRAITLFTPPACLVSILVAWFCLRNLPAVLVTLFLSGVATGAAVALIPLFGTKLDGLLTAVPSLIYVLAVSTCIHLVSYLRSASETLPAEQADAESIARRGFSIAWKPSVVSSVSTAVGMGSLVSSEFPRNSPVRPLFGGGHIVDAWAVVTARTRTLSLLRAWFSWRTASPAIPTTHSVAWVSYGNITRPIRDSGGRHVCQCLRNATWKHPCVGCGRRPFSQRQ